MLWQDVTREGGGGGDEQDPIAAEFAKAAAALREKLEEQSMCIEDKILKSVTFCMLKS